MNRDGRRRTVLALRLHLDEDLSLAHYFDDLADITPRLVQQLQLLP
jgi:hypothetical protein